MAQGLRSEASALRSVLQSLGTASGLLRVAVAGVTAVSDLIGELKIKAIAYDSASTAGKIIIQNDVNALVAQLDAVVNSSTFNGRNIVNVDQGTLAVPQPPDEGINFTLVGKNASNTHQLLSNTGFFLLTFTASGGNKDIELEVKYDGSKVDKLKIKKKDLPGGGSLSFIYPASPTETVEVKIKKGDGSSTVNYSFDLQTTASGGVVGDTQFLGDIRGNSINIQSRSHLAADLAIDALTLSNVSTSLTQLEAAEFTVAQNLGYYSAKSREIDFAILTNNTFFDATIEGLGAIVDADLGRESARLLASQLRESLALQSTSIANERPGIVLSLVEGARSLGAGLVSGADS